jgi:PAS domain S-box-containing protein
METAATHRESALATPDCPRPAAPRETLLGEWAASTAPSYCRDLCGRILVANAAFARKFGRPVQDITGQPAARFINPDDLPLFESADAELARPPHQTASSHRWLTPQGWRWIAWEELTLFDADGAARAVRAVGHDITRQRLAEELYYKLSRAVEQSPVGMVITDAEGRVQYVNPKFTEVSGLTLEDILDRNVPVLREGHASDEDYDRFWAVVRSGGDWQGELSRRAADGSVVWESTKVSCLRNAAGQISNFLCLREDITERKRLEEDLRQAQKMESLGTLAGGIAHDFNNLLAVILGYAEFSQMQANGDVALDKSLREIRRAAQRASGLVRQILTFSRKTEVHSTPLDLNQLLRDLVGLLAETFPRTVTFDLELGEGLPPLLADQNQLEQIVLNLCVNARDAMPSGGAITVSTSVVQGGEIEGVSGAVEKPYACLRVADTGMGMTPEVKARIFEPFFTTKTANQGTGIGLAVVHGIVANHRGFIQVDSVPKAGSTFRVYLPLAESASAARTVVASTPSPGGTESLLVVDDEDPLRSLLKIAFKRKGYRVTSAGDGLEAINLICDPACVIDAVLLDLNMPGANGLEVLKVINQRRPSVKVLVLTGHLSAEARAEFEQLGQKNFMSKPYTLDQLGRSLRRLLDARGREAGVSGIAD